MSKTSGGGGLVGRMHARSVAANNQYRGWVARHPKARSEVAAIAAKAKNIPNIKYRKKYIKKEKAAFDTRWTAAYASRNK